MVYTTTVYNLYYVFSHWYCSRGFGVYCSRPIQRVILYIYVNIFFCKTEIVNTNMTKIREENNIISLDHFYDLFNFLIQFSRFHRIFSFFINVSILFVYSSCRLKSVCVPFVYSYSVRSSIAQKVPTAGRLILSFFLDPFRLFNSHLCYVRSLYMCLKSEE